MADEHLIVVLHELCRQRRRDSKTCRYAYMQMVVTLLNCVADNFIGFKEMLLWLGTRQVPVNDKYNAAITLLSAFDNVARHLKP